MSRSFVRLLGRNRSIAISYAAAITLLLAVSVLRPGFGLGNANGFRSLAVEAAAIGLVATGQTLVIIFGGIDLSLPWVLTGAAVVMTMLTGGSSESLVWALPAVLALSGAVGLVNGWVIAYLRVSPVITTLSMNGILLGVVALLAGGQIVVAGYGRAPEALVEFVRARFLEVPNLVWLFGVVVLVLGAFMSLSVHGRRLYAVGVSRQVALFSGVNERRVTLLVYALSAVMSGLAGILLTAKFGRAFLGMGDPYLFVSVAVVAIGGASVLGGTGHIVGTVAGALLMATLNAAIPVFGLPRALQLISFGLVILLAVVFTGGSESSGRPPRPFRRGFGKGVGTSPPGVSDADRAAAAANDGSANTTGSEGRTSL